MFGAEAFALLLLLLNAQGCPRDPELQGRSVAVLGSVVLSPAFAALPPALAGQSAWIYLPPGDCDYDVVHVRLQSAEVYRHAFAAGLWEAAQEACMPEAVRVLRSGLEKSGWFPATGVWCALLRTEFANDGAGVLPCSAEAAATAWDGRR